MTKIQDGTGTGRTAAVTTNNRLATSSVMQQQDHFIAKDTGKVWSYTLSGTDPTGAGDNFFYFKNTSTEFVYNVSDIRFACTVAGRISVNVVSGTAVGGAAIPPVSRLANSVVTPDAICEGGVDITGLTSDGTAFLLTLEADKLLQFKTSSRLIIPPGQAFALQWSAASGQLYGTVSIYELPLGSIT